MASNYERLRCQGTTTFCTTTLRIMTLSIITLSMHNCRRCFTERRHLVIVPIVLVYWMSLCSVLYWVSKCCVVMTNIVMLWCFDKYHYAVMFWQVPLCQVSLWQVSLWQLSLCKVSLCRLLKLSVILLCVAILSR